MPVLTDWEWPARIELGENKKTRHWAGFLQD